MIMSDYEGYLELAKINEVLETSSNASKNYYDAPDDITKVKITPKMITDALFKEEKPYGVKKLCRNSKKHSN